MTHPGLLALGDLVPSVDPTVWIAPTAPLVGVLTVSARASVYYGSALRGDGDAITIGTGRNIQDGSIVHADPGVPVVSARLGCGPEANRVERGGRRQH